MKLRRTIIARNNGPSVYRGTAALAAKHRISFSVFQLPKVWQLIVARTIFAINTSAGAATSDKKKQSWAKYLDFCASVTSSYSPSLPVRTPSKYSRIGRGSENDDGFVFSRIANIRGKKPRVGLVGELDFASQIWQYQGSSSASASALRGGSQHVK